MPKNNALQEYFSVKFRQLLSGDPKGIPPWLEVIAEGDEGGLYLPTDAPWVVHRDFGTLVGGIRALLMQALNPGALAGVSQHSRYESDALGRLAGTIRWLTVTTFGSHAALRKEAERVNKLHTRVQGEYVDTKNEARTYRAADANLLLWVHCAFMESFLVAHESYWITPIPKGDQPTGADNYVYQWGRSVEPLGLSNVPKSNKELNEVLDGFRDRGELRVNEDTLRVVNFIRKPPLPFMARVIYGLLFQAAVISLRPDFRKMLNIKTAPDWFIRSQTKFILRMIRVAIGPENQIQEGALNRLKRIGLI